MLLRYLKKLLPEGRKLRTIPLGLARGVRMNLDLRSQSQRYFGLDEQELMKPLRRMLRHCQSCLDVGANDGYYTMIFLQSHAQKVIACEPGAATGDRLLENARANGHADTGRLRLERRLVGIGAGQANVAELLEGLPGPTLAKVDVDGMDLEVLQSAEGSPRLPEVEWLIEIHSMELEQACLAWFQAHGYETSIIPNAWWRCFLPEQRNIPHNRWILAVPCGPAVS